MCGWDELLAIYETIAIVCKARIRNYIKSLTDKVKAADRYLVKKIVLTRERYIPVAYHCR